MNIVIPIGGTGERFRQEGYLRPKPLINILGKPMIFWLIDSLNVNDDDDILIVYNQNLDRYNFQNLLKMRYPNIQFKFVILDNKTKGAADTIRIGLEQCENSLLNKRLVSLDCDTFYKIDVLNLLRESNHHHIISFYEERKRQIFSYIERDENGFVQNIREKIYKKNTEPYANTGCYSWNNGHEFLSSYKYMLCNDKYLSKSEHYLSNIFKSLCDINISPYLKIQSTIIDINDFVCVGVPMQISQFVSNNSIEKKMRFCFDLDNTLVIRVDEDYSNVQPNQEYIQMCQNLKQLGHTIIIYTARRMRTHGGNIGSVTSDIAKITIETLEKFNIPYDELYFGKPYADFYIDDLSVNLFEDIHKAIGFSNTKIQPRIFNNIVETENNTIIKTSKNDSIFGEIYWYEELQKDITIQELFPQFIKKHNSHSYEIQKIDGVPLGYLYANEQLMIKHLENLLDGMNRIHNAKYSGNTDFFNLNYTKKLEERYLNYDYSRFPNSNAMYHQLQKQLSEYLNQENFIYRIHGDMVLSNVLLSKYNQIKFIDMKGIQGDEPSIYGDSFYDYAKIYQSLIGYEHIQLDKPMNKEYMQQFIDYFENYMGKEKMKWIKIITNCHLLSLIPLHDNEKCDKYYKLIN